MQPKNLENKSYINMIEDKSIGHLFGRYANVLEIHLRFRQPTNSVMGTLVSSGKPAMTKYLFTPVGVMVLSTVLGYFVWMTLNFAFLAASASVGALCFLCAELLILMGFPIIIVATAVALLFANQYLRCPTEAVAALRGPTHISLSPLSMKLLWKGALFSSIGAMFGWSEITSVDIDLPADDAWAAPSVIITAKEGKISHTVPVRLDGFSSDDDRLIFLNSVDNHVGEERKTAIFKKYLSDAQNVSVLLAKVKEHTVDGLLAQVQDPAPTNTLLMDNSKDVASQATVVSTEASRHEKLISKAK